MANLVIVESPSKAKTIGRYLGAGYVVKASMGHLRDLPKSTMGVDIENGFTPQYLPMDTKAEIINCGLETYKFVVSDDGALTVKHIPKTVATAE